MSALPAFQEWTQAALAETLVIEKFETEGNLRRIYASIVIAKESYKRAGAYSAEAYIPNYLKARDYIYNDFSVKLQKDATMDVASYVSGTFLPALQAIADAGK